MNKPKRKQTGSKKSVLENELCVFLFQQVVCGSGSVCDVLIQWHHHASVNSCDQWGPKTGPVRDQGCMYHY